MRDRPEEEKDGEAADHGTGDIGQQCGMLGASAQMGYYIIYKHVEGGPGRVPDLELVVASDELSAVPEARR